jgi:hypothetical protein
MLDFVTIAAASLALVSFCTSLATVAILYAKRDDNPVTAPLQMQIDALRLGQTDIIDRVDQWTKRDRTRRLRQQESDEAAPPQIDPNDKAALRAIAKQRGMIR